VPYTVAHVAAVMPGYKLLTRAHVFSAAVIGSMVPDFGLILPRDPARIETHSLVGLFTFCLPVGLVAYWLTQLLIKPAILETLPDNAYLRLRSAHPAASLAKLTTWFTVSGALLFGAATHLIWDAFTHENARGVRALPFLSDYGPELEGHPLHLYRWLQYGSSILGVTVVVMALIVWLRHAPTPTSAPMRRIPRDERVVWRYLYLVPPAVSVVWVLWRTRWMMSYTPYPLSWALGGVAVATIRGAVVSLLFISALMRIRLASA
jgi:hypothetical protein